MNDDVLAVGVAMAFPIGADPLPSGPGHVIVLDGVIGAAVQEYAEFLSVKHIIARRGGVTAPAGSDIAPTTEDETVLHLEIFERDIGLGASVAADTVAP